MGFELKKGEDNHVHLEIIKAEFDPRTGKQKFKPFVQTFTPKEYTAFLEHPSGMAIVKVHHLPKGVDDLKTLATKYKNSLKVIDGKKNPNYNSSLKGARRVNIIDLSDSVASMFEGEAKPKEDGGSGDNGGADGDNGNGSGDNGDGVELKSMKNMKRADLDEYAEQFDIDPTEYTNATVLKEAIQLVIDEKGFE